MVIALTQPSNATTVTTLISRFRSDIGESDSTRSRFTNAQVRDLLNRATQTVATLTGEVEDDTTITLVDGQAEYHLPSDFAGISSIRVKRGINYINLERMNDDEFGVDIDGNLESKAIPAKYAIFNDSLRIAPTLANYISTEKLYVNYYSKPVSLDSNSQSVQLDWWTDNLVVMWAVFFANERSYTPEQRLAAFQSLTQFTQATATTYIKRPVAKPQTRVAGQ